ncbi:MAG: tetratricopeptide repeat protein, partial [Verrucomicrobiota bacterium]
GLLLLLAELLLPGASTAAGRPPQGLPVRTAAALALWVACLGLPSPARAASDEALERYRKGEYATSRQEYERLARENPDEFRLRFNAGAAAYKMDDFEGAAGLFEQVLRSPDLDLQQKAWYNLGNARFRAGESEQDPEKKRAQWQQALSSFTGALKLNPGDTAAQANHRATQQAIEAIPQPPPPQQGGKGKENSKNDPRQNSEGSKDAGQDSKDPKGGDPSKDDRKEGKEGKEGNSSGGDAESSKGSPNSQAKDPSQGKNPSQGGRGEPQDRKPGEARSNASSASGAKPAQSSGDRLGDEAQAGGEGSAGEPDKDARQGELMTIREAEKVLDGQKGAEKALVLRRRRGVVGDLGEGAGQAARRKAW